MLGTINWSWWWFSCATFARAYKHVSWNAGIRGAMGRVWSCGWCCCTYPSHIHISYTDRFFSHSLKTFHMQTSTSYCPPISSTSLSKAHLKIIWWPGFKVIFLLRMKIIERRKFQMILTSGKWKFGRYMICSYEESASPLWPLLLD